jgi:hypothetical protein
LQSRNHPKLSHFVAPRIFTVALVERFMAAGAQSDQVGVFIVALLSTQLLVMYLQILSGATDLTPPVIPLDDPLAKLFVRAGP